MNIAVVKRSGGNPVARRGVAVAIVVLAATALASLLASCSRRADERPQAQAPADTLANGLPRALTSHLASWAQVWRSAIPGFEADSLAWEGSVPFRFDCAWAGAAGASDDIRTRARVRVLSPDSTRSLDFDMYLDFDRDDRGAIRLLREPDSAPVLADFRSDTLWRVAFCGTVCAYDGAYWVDAERFALTGTTQSGPAADGPRQGFLDIYDLRTRMKSRWVIRLADDREYGRYAAASDSSLIARLEGAGFPGRRTSVATAGNRLQ